MARRPPALRSKARSTCPRPATGSASRAIYFGLADEQEGDATRIPLTDLPLVGEDGKATFPVEARPAAVDDAAARRQRRGAHARDRRPCRRALARPRRPPAWRRASASGPNSPATRCRKAAIAKFKVIRVDPTGARRRRCRAATGRWSASSATTSGTATAIPGTTSRSPRPQQIANGTIDATRRRRGKISVPVDWGRYRLEDRHRRPDRAGDQLRIRRRLVCRGDLDRNARRAGDRARQGKLRGRRDRQAESIAALCRRAAGDGRLRDAAHHDDGHRAGRRRDGRHPGRRRLGRRRLRHRDAVPSGRRQGKRACRRAPSASNG